MTCRNGSHYECDICKNREACEEYRMLFCEQDKPKTQKEKRKNERKNIRI